MKRAILKFAIFSILISSFLMINTVVFAEDSLKDVLTSKLKEEKDVCVIVKQSIAEGLDTKEVTKIFIDLGHDACLVIRCAVEGNGDLAQIINGALEAGATSDVCSRCAIDAGADPVEVARVLETGLGYSPPLAAGLTPIEIGLPGGNPGGGVISPSSF